MPITTPFWTSTTVASSTRSSGGLRYPRSGLSSLSPRSLALALIAAVALLLGSSPAWAAAGRLSVVNDRQQTVTLLLDRQNRGPVRANSRVVISVRPGRHEIMLRSSSGQTLLRTVELVASGSSDTVRLAALTAPVSVRNPLDRTVAVVVDGQQRLVLPPFDTRSLRLDLGRHSLAMDLNGRVIATRDLSLSASGSGSAAAFWAPTPAMVGTLVVDNSLPIAVTLTGSRGRSRTVPAFGSTTYDGVAEGTFSLTARRADGGELVDQLQQRVRSFDTSFVSVDAPRTGILVIDNQRRGRDLRVYVDGRYLTSIGAEQRRRVELSPGTHQLLVRDSQGSVVQRRTLQVDRYALSRLDVERSHGQTSQGSWLSDASFDDRDDGRDRDDRNSEHERPSASCSMN